MAMLGLGSLLRGTDWSQVTEYLSPVFFQIVPPLAVARQMSALTGAYLDKPRFARVAEELAAPLRAAGLPRPEPGGARTPPTALPPGSTQARGDLLLKLYFWQIFHAQTCLLDLRREAFTEAPAAPSGLALPRWQPQPLYIAYDSAFIEPVRGLYRGFYEGNEAAFAAALDELQLSRAKELFRQHFGVNQTAVSFSLAAFRTTFHGIFLACKQAKSRLHPNFLAFGAGLYCLYEHLETLGGTFDVRAAYFAAQPGGAT